jgi:catechol-2,3-dioxygenase
MPVHLTTGGFVRGSDAELKPNDFHLAFRVDEGLDELVSSLKDSDVPVYELADSPAAERQVFVQDPWGNVIELCKY